MSARRAGALRSLRRALRALRAPQWLHFLALPLAGVRSPLREGPRLPLAVIATAGALGWAYGLNAIAERATDRAGAKNPLVGQDRVGGAVIGVVVGAAVVAVAAAAPLGARAVICALTSLAAGAIYSVGPRAKARPFAGLVANGLIFAPLAALASTPSGAPAGFAALVVSFVALLTQNQLVHERLDAAEDAAAGALTTARLLGPTGTRAALAAITVAAACAVVAVAPAPVVAVVAVATLIVGGAIACDLGAPRARRLHRAVALGGGALLWAVSA